MHKLCEYLDDKLKMLERKVGNGELSNAELEYGDLVAHFKKSLLTNEAMENSGYSEEYRGDTSHGSKGGRGGMSYDDDMSFARGRTGNVRRDSMGRYSRGEGYSYADARDDMMKELHEAMSKAPDEETRMKLKHFMKQFED